MHRKRKSLVLSPEEQARSEVMAFVCLTCNRSLVLLPLPRRWRSWEDELRHDSLPSQMETWASIPNVSSVLAPERNHGCLGENRSQNSSCISKPTRLNYGRSEGPRGSFEVTHEDI